MVSEKQIDAFKTQIKYPEINGMKTCSNCLENKPLDMFSKITKNPKYQNHYITRRANCKKCRANYGWQKQLEKKLKDKPHLYVQCDNDDCCYIFSRNNKECPKCKFKR